MNQWRSSRELALVVGDELLSQAAARDVADLEEDLLRELVSESLLADVGVVDVEELASTIGHGCDLFECLLCMLGNIEGVDFNALFLELFAFLNVVSGNIEARLFPICFTQLLSTLHNLVRRRRRDITNQEDLRDRDLPVCKCISLQIDKLEANLGSLFRPSFACHDAVHEDLKMTGALLPGRELKQHVYFAVV